jgi:hypothetical protein
MKKLKPAVPATEYEREQLAQIRVWRSESPSAATRTFGRAAAPAVEMLERSIPEGALRAALNSVHSASALLTDRRSIRQRAGVDDIGQLRAAPLETCDRLAAQVSRRAMALGGGTGAVFGVTGVFGLVADVPSLIMQTFRTIHRTGLCYGDDTATPSQRRLAVAVFALASANTYAEKQTTLALIDRELQTGDIAWREGIERAAERELAKDAAIVGINNLGKTLLRRLGWRLAGESLPVVGAFVGGAVNAWYLREVARAARHTFQLRWLQAKYGPGLSAGDAEGVAVGTVIEATPC